nr:MAG TPA: hypothetical protein [Caudoviricetes sp.]
MNLGIITLTQYGIFLFDIVPNVFILFSNEVNRSFS